jgi:phage-related tail fiber protein
MTSPTVDRRFGVVGGVALKAPCRVASTGNLTLSGAQTINGVSVVADDRVLVKNQTTASSNGIYDAAAGAWTRALDFDGNYDLRKGTLVYVTGGTSVGKGLWTVTTTDPITVDTDSISFAAVLLTT